MRRNTNLRNVLMFGGFSAALGSTLVSGHILLDRTRENIRNEKIYACVVGIIDARSKADVEKILLMGDYEPVDVYTIDSIQDHCEDLVLGYDH